MANTATNRFTSTNFTYDKNGNITADIDPVTSQPRTFLFNGDNKQVEVKNASNVAIGKYYYDGEGKRVKKVTATETTIFVYSSGKLAEEYSTQISQTPTVAYTTTDHLGSPRVITGNTGNVISRRDFMPLVRTSLSELADVRATRGRSTLPLRTTSGRSSPAIRRTRKHLSTSLKQGCTKIDSVGLRLSTRC